MATYGGTTLSELITGSGLSDLISQLGGNDALNGGGFNDTLDGGTGTDSMDGGDGNDLYIVDSTKDVIVETGGNLNDRIQASISIDLNNVAYDGIEHVTLTGSSGLLATGDASKNILIGNTGANRVDGREGADTMIGGAGNDTYTSVPGRRDGVRQRRYRYGRFLRRLLSRRLHRESHLRRHSNLQWHWQRAGQPHHRQHRRGRCSPARRAMTLSPAMTATTS